MKKKICMLGIITTLVIVMASLGACSKAPTSTSQVTTKTSTTTSKTSAATTIAVTTSSPPTTTTTTPTSSSDIFSPAQNITTMKYTVVVSGIGSPTVASVPVYLKKDKVRMEMDEEGVSTIELDDLTTYTDYTYMPAQNTAYKTSNPGINVFDVATMLGGYVAGTNPQANGTETIDDIACQIYEFSDSDSGSTYKIWLWKDNGLPIKIVGTDSSGTHTIEYKNYDFSDIPDSMFILPAGVTMVQAPPGS
jgi:hypothetical protein